MNKWTKEALLDKMQAGYCDPKHLGLVKLFPPEITQWGIWHQEKPLPTYSKGRIAILGDAAHASSPYLSSGAGQGYEDAAICAELLENVSRRFGSQQALMVGVEKALHVYSEMRRERSQYVVHSSNEAGKVLMGDRQEFDKAADEYAQLNHEVWDYDISAAMKRAVRHLTDSL